jgi:hypothetical protein
VYTVAEHGSDGMTQSCLMLLVLLLLSWLLLMGLQEQQMIKSALAREVMRVHRQLQHASQQLKGPAKLPALQAWDAAFSQVSRTISTLVHLSSVRRTVVGRFHEICCYGDMVLKVWCLMGKVQCMVVCMICCAMYAPCPLCKSWLASGIMKT